MCDGRQFLKGWDDTSDGDREWYRDLARSALTAVTPLIEATALERAAKVAETYCYHGLIAPKGTTEDRIAAAIRALKQKASE